MTTSSVLTIVIPQTEQVFLNLLRDKKKKVRIYLGSGIKIGGIILGHDNLTILISSEGRPSQLIYKHAIATLSAFEEQ